MFESVNKKHEVFKPKNRLREFHRAEGMGKLERATEDLKHLPQKEKRERELFYYDQIIEKLVGQLYDEWHELNAKNLPNDGEMSADQIESKLRFVDEATPQKLLTMLDTLRVDWERMAEETNEQEEKIELYGYIDAASIVEADIANW